MPADLTRDGGSRPRVCYRSPRQPPPLRARAAYPRCDLHGFSRYHSGIDLPALALRPPAYLRAAPRSTPAGTSPPARSWISSVPTASDPLRRITGIRAWHCSWDGGWRRRTASPAGALRGAGQWPSGGAQSHIGPVVLPGLRFARRIRPPGPLIATWRLSQMRARR
jgi:hypothetical protein